MANGFGTQTNVCPTCGCACPTPGATGAAWTPGYGQGMGMRQQGFGAPYGGFQQGFVPPYGPGFYGPGFAPGYAPIGGMGYGPGMMGGWGAWAPSYTYPTYATTGIASDDQIEQMIYDSLDADPVIPYDSDIDVEVVGGVVTLTGTVPNKRIKHAVGDDAWWVTGVWDVNNNLEVMGRRAARTQEGGPETQTKTTSTRTSKPSGQQARG